MIDVKLTTKFIELMADTAGIKPGPYAFHLDGDVVEARTTDGALVGRIGLASLERLAADGPARCPECGQGRLS
ncbi:hypothetical protein R4172_04935 [Rhodococcus kroppenstedtii]|uniref:hypothetical protein n=1 Tax=Rhodococcoides kroppenstedtii TaxID=293050 RepID=UPI002954F500|nr:hypothetical protein [Rhodococcus kroppenstedtii]MDV7196905.1 hypothetical protein [Rhodococcus kroppenstedtii]